MPQHSPRDARIAAAVVTLDRPDDLRALLDGFARQTRPLDSVVLVDAGATPVRHLAEAAAVPVTYLRSEVNLGGAGGFALAILAALAGGAEWIWIMDDDAHPEDAGTLAALVDAATEQGLEAVLPLVVTPDDPTRLSFHFRVAGHSTHDRATVEAAGFRADVGHFFNGALIHRDVFYTVGLPDLRLFLRGDETDFMLRLRRAGVRFGTVTTAALRHPSGEAELRHVLGDRLHVLVPETDTKRFYFYRNRGQLIRRYRRVRSLVADGVGYPLYFLRRGDVTGLAGWARPFVAGLRNRSFGPPWNLPR
ncbi:galactofuranosyl transferase GlfT1 [Tersicoccus solisilvae]|uniref:Galactofuranosyl transferase GlfT1 n=1 Tax=Tersicoccus solisilvae TaxID=1882339 RepID=A0ABQ1P7W6_9MICC|nr:glycosyltransferase [Tersicoccus solisilvae]GGC92078.1 galactofuranosyl transferase GlfT1 [Tersicoccus solisilvae]